MGWLPDSAQNLAGSGWVVSAISTLGPVASATCFTSPEATAVLASARVFRAVRSGPAQLYGIRFSELYALRVNRYGE